MDLIHSDGELFIAGPDTAAQLVRISAARRSTAVRFAPGIGPAFLGVAASEVRDRRVPLRDLWPSAQVRRLTERLDETPDRATLLEQTLLAAPSDPDPLARQVLAHLRAGRPVAGIAAEIGLSERQLHRRGLFLYGYGVKTLDRILRLNGALDRARRGISYATVAASTGYSDQAHLAREVKALTGITMSELLKT